MEIPSFEPSSTESDSYKKVTNKLKKLAEFRQSELQKNRKEHGDITERIKKIEKEIKAINESIDTLLPTIEAQALLDENIEELDLTPEKLNMINAVSDKEEARRLLKFLSAEKDKKAQKERQLDNLDNQEKVAYQKKQGSLAEDKRRVKKILRMLDQN